VTKSSNLESEIKQLQSILNHSMALLFLLFKSLKHIKFNQLIIKFENPEIKADFIQSIQWMISKQRNDIQSENVTYQTIIVIDKQNQPSALVLTQSSEWPILYMNQYGDSFVPLNPLAPKPTFIFAIHDFSNCFQRRN
jgi:hypothetical protein